MSGENTSIALGLQERVEQLFHIEKFDSFSYFQLIQ